MTEASIAFVAGGSLAQRRNGAAGRLRDARTCYSHLAGRLGVALADVLVAARWLEEDGPSYRLTAAGTRSHNFWTRSTSSRGSTDFDT